MKKLLQLKTLAYMGTVVLVSVPLSLLIFPLCVPKFQAPGVQRQLYAIRLQDLRDNNPLYTDLFLKSIKDNNGYLILGTSETESKPNGNYADFLNGDTSLNCRFSVISAAGKTSSTYFPLIQSNENVHGLKLIYFINPTYWCNKFARNGAEYFHRYTSYTCYRKSNIPKDEQVDHILHVNLKGVRPSERIGDFLSFYTDRLRLSFYQDFRFNHHPEKFQNGLVFVAEKFRYQSYPFYGKIDSAHYNLDLNVKTSFNIHKYTFTVDTESSYRYDELRTMIALCKKHHVDVTFVIGPYNAVAFEKMHPSEIPHLENVCHQIQYILDNEKMPYVNAVDISSMSGTFDDWQHHSSYGAYLIYQKIKDYVLEKESR